jgi:hypothetical protein
VEHDPASNAAWRKWRSAFYFGLLVAGMLAVAVAGWWNLTRITSGGR